MKRRWKKVSGTGIKSKGRRKKNKKKIEREEGQ